jgi:hypothetical protein
VRSSLHRAGLAAALLASLLVSCAPPVREPLPAPALPPEFPEAHYREALAQGKPVFRVDPASSLVVIEVRRAGTLANLGHDHVIASHDLGGYVATEEGRGDLYVPLGRLAVDEAPLRAEAGLDTQPTESDIAGTRANMLGKVLEADRFPFALIQVSGVHAGKPDAAIDVTLMLHGTTRKLHVPTQIEAGADRVTVTGKLSFDQTDFGITPYSILGGAIAVRNRVDLKFHIQALRER